MNNPYDLTEDIEVTDQDKIDYLMKKSSCPYDPVALQGEEEILSRLMETTDEI